MKRIFITLTIFSLIAGLNSFTDTFDKQINDVDASMNDILDTSNQIFDDFDNGINPSSWYISKRAWGQNETYERYNGGVIPENVFVDKNEGTVQIRTLGNQYAKEEIRGVSDYLQDGSCTGGALVSKFKVRPGRFEARFKVAPRVGICNAFWIYNEDADGLNHEIDFEMPGKTPLGNNSYNQILCTNYHGESNYESYNYTSMTNVADGEYHTYTFDWYYSSSLKKIDYYLDGNLIQTSEDFIPFYENRIWIGTWIPNNINFVGLPNFEEALMEIDYVSFTPFKNQEYVSDDCFVNQGQVASLSEYPTSSYEYDGNMYPNGDFEYVGVKQTNLGNYGITYNGNYSFNQNSPLGHYLTINNGNIISSIDTCLGNTKYALNLDYQNQGIVKVRCYNEEDVLLNTFSFNLDSDTLTNSNDLTLLTPSDTFYVTIEISSTSSLLIDNVKFYKYIEEDEPITPTPSEGSDSYGVNLVNNSNVPVTSYITKQTYNFDGNENHPWVVSCFEKNNDGVIRLGYYDETNPSQSALTKQASIRYYGEEDTDTISNQFKKIYDVCKNDVMSGEDHFVQTVYMDYDITSFSDIAFYFQSFGIEGWQRNVILYSIDSGNSWNYLNHNFTGTDKNLSPLDKGTNYIDTYSVNATSDLLEGVNYSKIRFAYASIHFYINTQVIKMSGIVINRYDDYKNKLNGNTCNLTKEDLDILEVIYSHLTDDEINLSKNESLTNYPNKTYFEAYLEVLSRYSSSGSSNQLASFTFSESRYLLMLFLALSSSIVVLMLINKRFKRK